MIISLILQCDSHSPACCVPFLGLDVEHHPVGHYYQKIYKALQEIHETQGSPESVNCLLELAESRYICTTNTCMYILYINHD